MSLQVKRVYDEPAKSDGDRVLVDRLWPRGLKKSDAQLHEWLKDIAPSTTLRKSFGHAPSRWKEFKNRYWAELDDRRDQVEKLARHSRRRTVTLLFGARDTKYNNAMALREYIEQLK